ncbi:MAG TPA: LacI family DNA-binding transcriptional regulator [Conexibacter sp.]|jgi:LacI family transcriptional regulator
MREVAERAGVAMSSVSRVLSDHPDVSARMRARVMAAVDDLGYVPDLLAQGLRRQKTFSVGFAVADVANPVLAAEISGAESRLRLAGYSMLLTNSEGDEQLDAGQISLLEQRRVDGLLLSVANEHFPGTVDVLRRTDMPMVMLDRDVPEGVRARQVTFDHRAGMAQAAHRLLELGHREIALILAGPTRPVRERRDGIEATLLAAGARCTVYEGPFTIDYGVEATRDILAAEQRPTAIVAGGNLPMHGSLRALREASIRVGEDLSFVGCDDVAVAEFHDPPIAVVRRDTRRIGELAAGLLLADLGEQLGVEEIDTVLATEFVDRPSCAPALRR